RVGLDAQEDRLHAVLARLDLRDRLLALAGVLGIEVDRTDEPLLPEGAVERHRAAQPQQLEAGDLHRIVSPGWIARGACSPHQASRPSSIARCRRRPFRGAIQAPTISCQARSAASPIAPPPGAASRRASPPGSARTTSAQPSVKRVWK